MRTAKSWLRNCLGAALAASKVFSPPGSSQERSWTRLGVDLAGHRAPRAKQRVPGSILGAILAHCSLNFDVFRLCFCVCFSLHFPAVFFIVFLQSSFSFCFRAQTPDMRKMQHPPSENLFFLGALSRRRRQEDEEIETWTVLRTNEPGKEPCLSLPCFSFPYFCWKCARSAQSTGRLRRPLRGASSRFNEPPSTPLPQ